MDWLKRKLSENSQRIYEIQQENEMLDVHIDQKQVELDKLIIEVNQQQTEISKLKQRLGENKMLIENLTKINTKINNRIRKISKA